MAPKKVLVVAFKDVEDIELTVTVDVLRRADIDVTVANLNDEEYFVCSRKITIKADALFKDIEKKDFDAVIVPGKHLHYFKCFYTSQLIDELLRWSRINKTRNYSCMFFKRQIFANIFKFRMKDLVKFFNAMKRLERLLLLSVPPHSFSLFMVLEKMEKLLDIHP